MLTPVLILFLAAALAPLVHRAFGKRTGVLLAAAPALLFAHFARFLAPSAAGQAFEASWPGCPGSGSASPSASTASPSSSPCSSPASARSSSSTAAAT